MAKTRRALALGAALLAALTCFQSCASVADAAETRPATDPAAVRWPKEKLRIGEDGAPVLRVYVVEEESVREESIETYVEGVLAGEMKNDWPLEALKAQAILARTFVLKFVQEKESRYPGADISTDIEEAQAYDASAVNARVRQAVRETRGQTLASEGELPYAWFHAHSGGLTEYAQAGLGWNRDEPPYTTAARGTEPEELEDERENRELQSAAAWEAEFTAEEIAAACRKQGVKALLHEGSELAVGQRGESGRAVTLEIDGQSVDAAELRIALGSTKMRSTLLKSLKMKNGKVYMAGAGYGHGVGMSQWGAYGMARQGKNALEIVKHYFQSVDTVKLWE